MFMKRLSLGLRRLAHSLASDPDLITAGNVTMKDLLKDNDYTIRTITN